MSSNNQKTSKCDKSNEWNCGKRWESSFIFSRKGRKKKRGRIIYRIAQYNQRFFFFVSSFSLKIEEKKRNNNYNNKSGKQSIKNIFLCVFFLFCLWWISSRRKLTDGWGSRRRVFRSMNQVCICLFPAKKPSKSFSVLSAVRFMLRRKNFFHVYICKCRACNQMKETRKRI